MQVCRRVLAPGPGEDFEKVVDQFCEGHARDVSSEVTSACSPQHKWHGGAHSEPEALGNAVCENCFHELGIRQVAHDITPIVEPCQPGGLCDARGGRRVVRHVAEDMELVFRPRLQ